MRLPGHIPQGGSCVSLIVKCGANKMRPGKVFVEMEGNVGLLAGLPGGNAGCEQGMRTAFRSQEETGRYGHMTVMTAFADPPDQCAQSMRSFSQIYAIAGIEPVVRASAIGAAGDELSIEIEDIALIGAQVYANRSAGPIEISCKPRNLRWDSIEMTCLTGLIQPYPMGV